MSDKTFEQYVEEGNFFAAYNIASNTEGKERVEFLGVLVFRIAQKMDEITEKQNVQYTALEELLEKTKQQLKKEERKTKSTEELFSKLGKKLEKGKEITSDEIVQVIDSAMNDFSKILKNVFDSKPNK